MQQNEGQQNKDDNNSRGKTPAEAGTQVIAGIPTTKKPETAWTPATAGRQAKVTSATAVTPATA
jgi:hypothetical protein